MIGADELDFHSLRGSIEVCNGELRRSNRSEAAPIGVEPRHVRQDTDLHHTVSILRMSRSTQNGRGHGCKNELCIHKTSPSGFSADVRHLPRPRPRRSQLKAECDFFLERSRRPIFSIAKSARGVINTRYKMDPKSRAEAKTARLQTRDPTLLSLVSFPMLAIPADAGVSLFEVAHHSLSVVPPLN
jgi:hypothetical protein